MSYNLLILVLSILSSMTSFGEIYLAASSREMTPFHVTNSLINYWQKFPKDLTFFFLRVFLEFLFAPSPFF